MTDQSNPLITKVVMEQYENLRHSGEVNILDTNATARLARLKEYNELANLIENNLHSYLEIMSRHKFYMKKYKMRSYRR